MRKVLAVQGRMRVLVMVLALAVVLLIAGGVALANHGGIPADNSVSSIQGCYENQNPQETKGALRVVPDNTVDCKGNETPIEWLAAVPGPPGSQGNPGPAGPQGDPGPSGVSNLQRVSNQATISTNNFLLVSASCTDGRVVLGGGVSASNSNINVWINQPGIGINDPGGSGGWTGGAGHAGGSPGFTLKVYAICATVAP